MYRYVLYELYCYFSINSRISNNSHPLTLRKVFKFLDHNNFDITYDRGMIQRPLDRSFQDLSYGTKYMWVWLIFSASTQSL